VGVAVTAIAIALVGLSLTDAQAQKNKKYRVKEKGHTIHIETQGAFLGITMQSLTDELREGLGSKADEGVLVNSVIEGSAADKAGIEEGDVIVEFDGQEVDSPTALRELIGDKEVGDEVSVKIVRDDKRKTIDVTLGDWEDNSDMVFFNDDGDGYSFSIPQGDEVRAWVANLQPRQLGVRVHEPDDDLASYFGVKEDEGVLVLGVEEGSTAEDAGLKSGDVIVKINDEDISEIHDIRDAIAEMEKGDEVEVTVVRKKKKVKLEGEIQDARNAWSQHFGDMREHMRGMRGMRAPRVLEFHDNDLRKEIDELRKELHELKEELKKS
jgi:serine protease Do